MLYPFSAKEYQGIPKNTKEQNKKRCNYNVLERNEKE